MYRIYDLLDVSKLQLLMESFYKSTGIGAKIVDVNGDVIANTGWNDICAIFHRKSPCLNAKCKERQDFVFSCDNADEAALIYKCPTGLIDIAYPIIVGGKNIATIFQGQFFNDEPNMQFFTCQAQNFGFDKYMYLEAVSKTPIISEEKLHPIINYFSLFAQLLADNCNKQLKQLETEQTLRLTQFSVDNSAIPTYLIDSDAKILDVNIAACESLGYTKDELVNMSVFDIDPVFNPQMWVPHIKNVKEKRKAVIKTCHKTKTGKVFPVEIDIAYFEYNGKDYNFAFAKDISGLIESTKKLWDSQEKLNLIMNNVPQFIYWKDRDLKYIKCNKNLSDLAGLTNIDDICGKTDLDLPWGTGDSNLFCKSDKNVLDSGNPEYNIIGKIDLPEKTLWGSTSKIPTRDSNDNITGVFSICQDITGLKKIEEQLRFERDRSENYLNIAKVIIMVLDKNGKVSLINKTGCDILGYAEEEIIGKDWFDNFTPKRLNQELKYAFNDMMDNKKAGCDMSLIENNILTKNGIEKIIVWNNALLFDDDGNNISVLSSGLDITEQKKIENELIRIKNMESLGFLAGGIAHDFNNLLTGIIGYISLIKSSVDNDTKTGTMLSHAEFAAFRAKDLSQQLLTFAKGGLPVKKISSVAELVMGASKFSLSGSNINCQYCIPKDLWNADIDVGQITQVINNIIINAIQAMPCGGVITIKCDNVVFDINNAFRLKKGNYVKVSIEDQGSGIASDYADKVFTPYFTTKDTGSGLGLAISYSIIKKHEGYITFESKEGIGTRFDFFIPASEKLILEEPPVEDLPFIDENKGKGSILIMDDNSTIRALLEDMLERIGYKTIHSKDGSEAIELYKHDFVSDKSICAVIMDLTIPGAMGGKEAIQELLKINPDIIAFVSSGYSNDPVMSDIKKYGFAGSLSKPYGIDELRKVLKIIR